MYNNLKRRINAIRENYASSKDKVYLAETTLNMDRAISNFMLPAPNGSTKHTITPGEAVLLKALLWSIDAEALVLASYVIDSKQDVMVESENTDKE